MKERLRIACHSIVFCHRNSTILYYCGCSPVTNIRGVFKTQWKILMELFSNIVNAYQSLTIFTKCFILDGWLGFEYTFDLNNILNPELDSFTSDHEAAICFIRYLLEIGIPKSSCDVEFQIVSIFVFAYLFSYHFFLNYM